MSELRCAGGTSWKALNRKLAISQTKSCELLCKQQNENGCCHLSKEIGCAWLADGKTIWDGPSEVEGKSSSKSSICMYRGTALHKYRNNLCYCVKNNNTSVRSNHIISPFGVCIFSYCRSKNMYAYYS